MSGQTVVTPTSAAVSHPTSGPMQVISWGTSQDLAYNGSGGANNSKGPFVTSILRLAIGSTSNCRVAIGTSTVDATVGTWPLLVGPCVEFVAITSGQYVAAISNDASTSTLNITPAL